MGFYTGPQNLVGKSRDVTLIQKVPNPKVPTLFSVFCKKKLDANLLVILVMRIQVTLQRNGAPSLQE